MVRLRSPQAEERLLILMHGVPAEEPLPLLPVFLRELIHPLLLMQTDVQKLLLLQLLSQQL